MKPSDKKAVQNSQCTKCLWDPGLKGGPYYHNSVSNPKFPGPVPLPPCPGKTYTLAVHGMMTSSHYHRARRLAEILRGNIPQCCLALEIRSMTETEWYDHHVKIKRTHGGQAYAIKNPVACFVDNELIGDDVDFSRWICERYDLTLCEDFNLLVIREWNAYVDKSKFQRQLVFIQISIDGIIVGTLLFQGNFVANNRRGVLSMVKRGRHIDNNTQFMVSLCPTPWMSPKFTAFGQLIDGEETLRKIEAVPTHYQRPLKRIEMTRCGIFNRQNVLDEPKPEALIHVKAHVAADVENVNQTATWLRDIMVENAMKRIQWRETERTEAMSDEGENSEVLFEPSDATTSSMCSCAIDECDVCGRVPSRDLYWPPHDILDPRDKPLINAVASFKKGWYFAETDLRTYLPPIWMRGFAHSEVTLSYDGKENLCQSVFDEVLQRMEMTPAEIHSRKILQTVMANVAQTLSEKHNFPNFSIVKTI